ncbi:endonuclease MutS2 [Bacillus sp. HMF5848]|uniref:endonuclease MutS2 n=1 Tax=Bacillus sp. HMF5848 TaxID=2495421 RepID=UPI000F7920E2|nr:endonuclease MutS2 [Bacillus sp. HMF5848]RSK28090.1 endonuclease MutS2 [Bacillus sp. HMF5848]
MQKRALKVLEYDKVIEQLSQHVSSSLGREKATNLMPSSSYEDVMRWQLETDEAAKVLRLKGQFPLGGITDIRPHIKRASIGGMLSPNELLHIAGTVYASRQIKQFVEEMVDAEIDIPIIEEYADQLNPPSQLEQNINHCIDEYGGVMDGASDKLRSIRQQLRTAESRIREKLESMVRSSQATKMLSDAIITIRNDRYVLPVKQEYRSAYGGIVHDQSSSGATLFIEPQVIVDLNNTLQEARVREKQEIERILIELSEQVAEHVDVLRENVLLLTEFDFMFAKAAYAKKIKATKPKINNYGHIKVFKARHPLLEPKEVVPNDIEIGGEEFSTIVITGPNTGGKTVTLKTAGLFTLMAQAGLQIPAEDGSEMTVFDNVYADIGDEQSIEQSLSTFSSHMVNIVDILKQASSDSLVLFDELGAGTDPQEGAALAISILDEVHNRGARVIATTHYPELKAYGYNRDGVINASVEFDIESLRPTYRLLIGVPGRSNAFEISRRLGLGDHVINRAKGLIDTDTNTVENMIAALEDNRRKAEEELQEAETIRKQAEELHRELQQQIIELNENRNKLLEKAEKKAKNAVEEAQAEAESIIKELKRMRSHAQIKEHELIDARKRLESAAPTLSKKIPKSPSPAQQKRTLTAGDEVKVLSFNQKGHLIEKVNDREWQVQMGIMKMKVKEKDMEFISSPTPVETKPLAAVKGKQYHVSLELDLRGERYEDALLKVEKYIDDALLAGYPRVSIIHGKGTGALRKGVREYLEQHRSVKGIRYGEAGEGGTGVTIVEFK